MQKMQSTAQIFNKCAKYKKRYNMKKIGIFASGSGTNAENIIRYFSENENGRVAVVLSNKTEAGVHERAKKYEIPSFSFSGADFREGTVILRKLAEYDIDFIVLAGFLALVPPVIINAYRDNIINIHPALLPKFGGKGMYGHFVHEAVIAAKEPRTGITIHYVNERYDEGSIIFQAEFPVLPTYNVEDVERKIHELEYKHFPEIIESLCKELCMKEQLSELFYTIFDQATNDYHKTDNVDALIKNPYEEKSLNFYLYLKNWIDAVQWHLEDIIRDPNIDPVSALAIKRRIDRSNQDRTDLVELIDSYFLDKYKEVSVLSGATINTESPAWAIDRLSILVLKIFHMQSEVERTDVSAEHIESCKKKLDILFEQKKDLSAALDQLLDDIGTGRKYMKVYKQMKMYNDPSLNPVLYGKK